MSVRILCTLGFIYYEIIGILALVTRGRRVVTDGQADTQTQRGEKAGSRRRGDSSKAIKSYR